MRSRRIVITIEMDTMASLKEIKAALKCSRNLRSWGKVLQVQANAIRKTR